MHEGNAELLRAVDPRALGARLKAARVARGITQSALAGDGISTGYVSRIESGVRRPTLKVLTELARRLDKPVDQLLRGVSSTEYDEIRLSLDYAELALENGEGQEAERHARDALTRAELASLEQLQSRGHYLLGRAYENQGRLDDAIRELEQAVASDSSVSGDPCGHRADPLPPLPGRPDPGHRGRRAHPCHAARRSASTGPTRPCSSP